MMKSVVTSFRFLTLMVEIQGLLYRNVRVYTREPVYLNSQIVLLYIELYNIELYNIELYNIELYNIELYLLLSSSFMRSKIRHMHL